MNKDEEIDKHLDDIILAMEHIDKSLFAIGIMVVGVGGMTIGVIGLIIVGMI